MPGSLAFLLAICALWLHQQTTQACSCYPTHPQMKFCSSTIVVKVKVIKETKIPHPQDQRALRNFVVKQIKMYRSIRKMEVKNVITPYSSAACGITLKKDTQYLLGGSIDRQGRFIVGLCDLVLEWNSLSMPGRNHINHSYNKGCGCKIKWCHGFPCAVDSSKECLWTDLTYQVLDLACLPHWDGTCRWNRKWHSTKKSDNFQNAIEP
uniref:metalloproteinase inhibitor 4-like n=1 Tax=Myxine glutinosa TaxID=7769 RepID=UPI00358F53E1